MRVHIVEDDLDVANMLQMHLEGDGIEVSTTTSRFTSLLAVEQWEGVDVAVIDLMLPGEVSGGEILCWLIDHHPGIRRVILSAVASQRPEWAELADRVLDKPADLHAIRTAIGLGRV